MNRPKRQRHFQKYKNAGGKSVVARFEVAKDAITVVFTNNTVYRYTNQSATPGHIAEMKKLALAGKGLGTFIESKAKDLWLQKVR